MESTNCGSSINYDLPLPPWWQSETWKELKSLSERRIEGDGDQFTTIYLKLVDLMQQTPGLRFDEVETRLEQEGVCFFLFARKIEQPNEQHVNHLPNLDQTQENLPYMLWAHWLPPPIEAVGNEVFRKHTRTKVVLETKTGEMIAARTRSENLRLLKQTGILSASIPLQTKPDTLEMAQWLIESVWAHASKEGEGSRMDVMSIHKANIDAVLAEDSDMPLWKKVFIASRINYV